MVWQRLHAEGLTPDGPPADREAALAKIQLHGTIAKTSKMGRNVRTCLYVRRLLNRRSGRLGRICLCPYDHRLFDVSCPCVYLCVRRETPTKKQSKAFTIKREYWQSFERWQLADEHQYQHFEVRVKAREKRRKKGGIPGQSLSLVYLPGIRVHATSAPRLSVRMTCVCLCEATRGGPTSYACSPQHSLGYIYIHNVARPCSCCG